MDLETLHRRVIKLEKFVKRLSKWTQFNSEILPDSEDEDIDKFPFEIQPELGNGDSSSPLDDDSDYTPKPTTKRRKRSSKRRGGRGSSGYSPGAFKWPLPTPSSSSVQNASTDDNTVNPIQEGEIMVVKTEVTDNSPFANDFDIDGLLYPEQTDDDDSDNTDNGTIQVIPSQKGRPMIEKDGYLFQCAKHSSQKKIWRCDHFRNSRCPVRLHTNDNLEYPRVLLFAGEHNHEPNPHASEVRKVVAVIRQEALNTSTPAAEIIEKCLGQLPPEMKDFLPRTDALKRSIRNVRGEINSSGKPRRKFPRFRASSNEQSQNVQNTSKLDDEEDSRLAAQPLDNVPLQLLESRRKKPMLEKGGYLFQLSKLGNNKRIWRCDRFKALTCPVRIHTTFDLDNLVTLGQLGVHSHPPNPLTLEVRRVMAAIRQEALTTTQTPGQIVNNYLPQLPPEAKEMIRVDNVKRGIRKVRESLQNQSSVAISGYQGENAEDLNLPGKNISANSANTPQFPIPPMQQASQNIPSQPSISPISTHHQPPMVTLQLPQHPMHQIQHNIPISYSLLQSEYPGSLQNT